MDKFLKDKAYHIRVMMLLMIDIIIIQIASFFALYIRYDFKFTDINSLFLDKILYFAPYNTAMIIMLFSIFKLYSSIWKYASIEELLKILEAGFTVFVLVVIEMKFCNFRVPRSYPFIFVVLLMALTICERFWYRFLRFFKYEMNKSEEGQSARTMIIGGGQAAAMLLKEIKTSACAKYNAICIIDDDKNKRGKYISGVRIVGGRDRIIELAEKYQIDQIIVAMPSVNRKNLKDILNICKETNCVLKKIPGIYQLMNGSVSVSDIQNVEIEDLLGREPVKVDMAIIKKYVFHKTILVTGGGGSIGSELCRQLSSYEPDRLIIVDIYENNAYDIQQELLQKFPELDVVVLIASVRNAHRMNQIFAQYKPDIVYHAAAHKHVPLMEMSPNEAIKNNVFGTYKTALAAANNGVKNFVLISTDKAVNPTNIMGASKRLCEMVIQMLDHQYSDTNFVAVRFGNVLGSNGSVIPLFEKQIQNGGPITVTDPEIIRYFMTIPEAVSLVLQAGVNAKGGEIFILNMGAPMKILDLAKNLIRLSGYTEDEIEIKFTGLRPGEKLYEELLMNEEGLKETENKLIFIGKPLVFDEEEFLAKLQELEKVCENDDCDIKSYVHQMVLTYNYEGNKGDVQHEE